MVNTKILLYINLLKVSAHFYKKYLSLYRVTALARRALETSRRGVRQKGF